MGRPKKILVESNIDTKVNEMLTPNQQGKYLVWPLHFSHIFKEEKINDDYIDTFEFLSERMFEKDRV